MALVTLHTEHLACALFDVGVDGSSCLFLSTVHDHNHVRMWLAWTASNLPLMVNRQIADDLIATLQHLATPRVATFVGKGAAKR